MRYSRSLVASAAISGIIAGIALSTALPGCASPARPDGPAPAAAVNITSISDSQDPVPVLYSMLVDYRRYTETLWHSAGDKGGYWGTGKAVGGNEGVRACSTTALVYALLWKQGDHSIPISDRVDPALRYSAVIHLTGDQKGTDDQTWGNSWQSAMWAGNMAVAAWIAKDQLRPDTLKAVERVVAYEADRFIDMPPPTMEPGDTKAEENAWDLTAPAAAILLMPDNPHVKAWQEAVLRWGFNTISVEQDKNNATVADGKPIKEWVSTVQLFPDYTLENHGIFHPVYAMVAPATMAQAAVDYRLGGKPVPDALEYNVEPEWGMLRYIALPDGEWIYPQGLDWDLHDYEHIHYWTMLATIYHDPVAALLERRTAQLARRRQQLNGDGSFVGPSGSLGYAREAVQAERVAFAWMMHQQFGAPPKATEADWKRMEKSLEPVKAFDRAGFVLHHTDRGLFSFSWKNHLMGIVAPQPRTLEKNPYVTTPFQQSLVGRFTLEGQKPQDVWQFTVHSQGLRTDKSGFVSVVDAGINGGKLRQQIAVATVAPGVLAYLDRVTAVSDVAVTEEQGLLVGIENDEVSGGQRTISSSGGAPFTITGGAAGDHALTGTWANVDGRLGLVSPGSSLLYRSVGKPNRAGAREDFLIGAFNGTRRAFTAGAVVSERAGLLLPDSTPEETARLAADVKVEKSAQGRTLRFKGPDGRAYTLTLNEDGTAAWQGKLLPEEKEAKR